MWKYWLKKFWWVHGEIFIYGTISTLMASGFICVGKIYEDLKELKAAGIAILIGILMYIYNKIRSNGKEPIKSEDNK